MVTIDTESDDNDYYVDNKAFHVKVETAFFFSGIVENLLVDLLFETLLLYFRFSERDNTSAILCADKPRSLLRRGKKLYVFAVRLPIKL